MYSTIIRVAPRAAMPVQSFGKQYTLDLLDPTSSWLAYDVTALTQSHKIIGQPATESDFSSDYSDVNNMYM